MSTVNTAGNGRAGRGQFGPGNRYGQGNPNVKRMYELRQALLESLDTDAVQRVGRRLLALAEGGDVTAAKLLFDYTLGKPPQALELSGLGGEPLGLDWERLQSVLLTSLARFPDARLAVVMALKGMVDADATGPPDSGPGPGGDDALGAGD